jgi:hypothetical protein
MPQNKWTGAASTGSSMCSLREGRQAAKAAQQSSKNRRVGRRGRQAGQSRPGTHPAQANIPGQTDAPCTALYCITHRAIMRLAPVYTRPPTTPMMAAA